MLQVRSLEDDFYIDKHKGYKRFQAQKKTNAT